MIAGDVMGGYKFYNNETGELVEKQFFVYEYERHKQYIINMLCFVFLTSDKLKFSNPDDIKVISYNVYSGFKKFKRFCLNVENRLSAQISENYEMLPEENSVLVASMVQCMPFKPSYLKNWELSLLLYCFDQKSLLDCYF
jgi:hypothetical protein